MQLPGIIKNNPVIAAVAVAAGGVALWLALRGAKQAGKDIGGGVVNMAFGVASGAGGAVVDNLNDPKTNPLHGVGTWLGGVIFDATHPVPAQDKLTTAIKAAKGR